jgi:hypothetical protein
MSVLTSDNPPLSSPKNSENPAAGSIAVVCTEEATGAIADLVRESLAPNTRAAYPRTEQDQSFRDEGSLLGTVASGLQNRGSPVRA